MTILGIPGPIPYSQYQERYYFGRFKELRDVYSKIITHQLTILTADSGAGKSSIINAGIVPMLRRRRHKDIYERFTSPMGITLVLRQWGEEPLLKGIESYFEEVDKFLKKESEVQGRESDDELNLRRINSDKLVVSEIISKYQNRTDEMGLLKEINTNTEGDLILILDQFEEYMGSGIDDYHESNKALNRALKMVSSIIMTCPGIRVVLSLRKEYIDQLQPLEDLIGVSLGSMRYNLPSISNSQIKEILSSIFLVEKNVDINSETIDMLSSWIIGDAPSEANANMLKTQALLVNVLRFAENCVDREDFIQVSKETLVNYLMKVFSNEDSAKITDDSFNEFGSKLADNSLEEYILNLFYNDDKGVSLTTRMIVQLAGLLTTPGGYKAHISKNQMYYNVLLPELSQYKQKYPDFTYSSTTSFETLVEDVEIFQARLDTSGIKQQNIISGNFYIEQQRDADVLRSLGKALADAIMVLVKHQIVKKHTGVKSSVYELVHDGFCTPLLKWADSAKKTISYTLWAITGQIGQTFSWEDVKDDILGCSWIGCFVHHTTFKDCKFDNCELKATVFSECVFDNTTFTNCDLSGILFKNCIFKNESMISNCYYANAHMIESTIMGLKFKNVNALRAVFAGNNKVSQSVVFDKCILRFASISFDRIDGCNDEISIGFDSCDLRYSEILIDSPLNSAYTNCLENPCTRTVIENPEWWIK